MESKYTPDIRFRGFEDSWDNSPLYTYLTTSHEKNKSNIYSKDDVLSVSREYGVVNQIEYQGKSLAGASVSGYGVAQTNDIIYTKSPLRDQPYGIIKTSCIPTGIVSALYAVYHPNDNVCPQFVQTYFESDDRLNAYLRVLVRKGAKNTLNVGDEDALNGYVAFPKKKEQEQILQTFKVIDNRISKQRILCEQLRRLKSAMLDKLFPKAGADTPELGFGDRNDLREIKAIEVFTTISQKGFPNLPILSASQEYGMILRSENGIEMSYGTSNISGYKRVQPHQFVIHLRSFQGGFAHSDIEGITSPAYTILQFKESNKHDDYYWKYLLTSPNFIKRLEAITYGIRDGKSIKFEDVANLVFYVPSWKEQQRIGELLKTYDKLIALNEKKLEKLRNLKSAMLDKLFV